LKSLKNEDDKFNVAKIDLETNILKDVFQAQFLKINKMSAESKDDLRTFQSEFQNISLELDYNDL
jgi:dimeric dUTPase (all-alpha-NTP-PPase superfamily)